MLELRTESNLRGQQINHTLHATATLMMRCKSVTHNVTQVRKSYIDGLAQDGSISSALTMEILQSCTKPLICHCFNVDGFTQNYVNSIANTLVLPRSLTTPSILTDSDCTKYRTISCLFIFRPHHYHVYPRQWHDGAARHESISASGSFSCQ